MKVISLINEFDLTRGKVYEVIDDCYDSVYEVVCDDGKTYCRNKEFFKVMTDRFTNEIDIVVSCEPKDTALDMLKGNIARVCVTDDIEELINMYQCAQARLRRLYFDRYDKIYVANSLGEL